MKFKYLSIFLLGASLTGLTACNDYLDVEPQSDITPAAFFTTADDLAAYTINLYNGTFDYISPGSYGISIFGWDNDTDNQAGVNASATRWVPGQWKVGTSNYWTKDNWAEVRSVNYFFDQVLPKYEAGQISGGEANVKHYIGEAYVIRAMVYFGFLQNIGDCPIVTTALSDIQEELTAASVRQPRHKVARFILEDLDKAISLLSEVGPGGKNRVTKDVAYLLKSRVALYEATWEKHHAGTAFVPGGQGWPGSDAQGYNAQSEIDFFFKEAMAAAKVVGDKLVDNLAENTGTQEGMDGGFNSLNPYYTMFCDTDMDKYDEVLMWREYIEAQGLTHNIQMQLQNNGGGSGWTRGLVNSFVMQNGLPIYAAGSGYDAEWEKEGVKATLQGRDSRLQIFTKQEGDIDMYASNGDAVLFNMHWLLMGNNETRYVTGYGIKKGKHYDSYMQTSHHKGTTGSIVFRGTEALLNYMEACVESTGAVDGTADKYWKALRKRAKVNEDYMVTVNATDLNKEAEGDWAVYSKGEQVSSLLYNVRRERRNEFIGEGMRWADLKRWRALDQVKNYQVSGMRYWGSVYEGTLLDADNKDRCIVDVEGGTGNMSAKEDGVYVLPNRISAVNNLVFDGYTWCEAHYLAPLAQSVFRQTATGDQTDLTTSNVYQNPGWPLIDGQAPTGY
ncbi:MAG: RagB/SusD family nutrient uptake outer membrane protein [Bacteroides sp.]|nr:RagB/SusD family nutrient uptake outer membrane protein [Bacteroides sp.]